MSDDIDMAQDHMEKEEQLRKQYYSKLVKEVEGAGECLNCKEPLSGKRRWCDSHCREDWEKRRK